MRTIAKSTNAGRQELEITGRLSLPEALPAWELQLILPALASLLTLEVPNQQSEEITHGCAG